MAEKSKDYVAISSARQREERRDPREGSMRRPESRENYKLPLKNLNSIPSFLHGILSSGWKTPLGRIPSVR